MPTWPKVLVHAIWWIRDNLWQTKRPTNPDLNNKPKYTSECCLMDDIGSITEIYSRLLPITLVANYRMCEQVSVIFSSSWKTSGGTPISFPLYYCIHFHFILITCTGKKNSIIKVIHMGIRPIVPQFTNKLKSWLASWRQHEPSISISIMS